MRPARARGTACPDDDVVLPDREARVVLVDERLSVEAESLRVRAEETPHVRRCREDVEALVLERTEVLGADLRPLLELREVEVLTQPCLAEAGADVEHARGMINGRCETSVWLRLRVLGRCRASVWLRLIPAIS